MPPGPSAGQLAAKIGDRDSEVVTAIQRFVVSPEPNPEQLHELHAALRRLRVEYRLWRTLLPKAASERAVAFDRRLAEAARRVGEVRDADVQLQILEAPPDGKRSPGGAAPAEHLARLRDDARIGRELLRAYLQAELHAGLFDGLRVMLDQSPTRTALAHFPETEVDRARARLWKAYRKARERLSPQRAHFLRLRLRRSRYLVDFLGLFPTTSRGTYPERLVRLQRLLGRLHDLDLLADWIEGLPERTRRSDWAVGLLRKRKETRALLRKELERKILKEEVRSLGA